MTLLLVVLGLFDFVLVWGACFVVYLVYILRVALLHCFFTYYYGLGTCCFVVVYFYVGWLCWVFTGCDVVGDECYGNFYFMRVRLFYGLCLTCVLGFDLLFICFRLEWWIIVLVGFNLFYFYLLLNFDALIICLMFNLVLILCLLWFAFLVLGLLVY